MRIQFSQKNFKHTALAQQIHDMCYACIAPRYRQGLLIKVMFYTNPEFATRWRGSYRDIYHHGLYENEWDIHGIEAVITLKVGLQVPIDKLLYLIAHETGHHIIRSQDKRGGEVKADKIAARIIKRLRKGKCIN